MVFVLCLSLNHKPIKYRGPIKKTNRVTPAYLTCMKWLIEWWDHIKVDPNPCFFTFFFFFFVLFCLFVCLIWFLVSDVEDLFG